MRAIENEIIDTTAEASHFITVVKQTYSGKDLLIIKMNKIK